MLLLEEYIGIVVNDAIPLESDAVGNGHVTDTSSVLLLMYLITSGGQLIIGFIVSNAEWGKTHTNNID